MPTITENLEDFDVWTFGYRGQRRIDLLKWMRQKSAQMLEKRGEKPKNSLDLSAIELWDVRHKPYSRSAYWRMETWPPDLRSIYVHASGFGNVNYRKPTAPIKLADPEPWFRRLGETVKSKAVVLMCGCSVLAYRSCHRTTIADELNRRDIPTTELLVTDPAKMRPNPFHVSPERFLAFASGELKLHDLTDEEARELIDEDGKLLDKLKAQLPPTTLELPEWPLPEVPEPPDFPTPPASSYLDGQV